MSKRTTHGLAVFRAEQSVASAELHLAEARERLRLRKANPHADEGTVGLLENGVRHAEEGLAAARYTLEVLNNAPVARATGAGEVEG